ncbi:MAG: hypothetical protein U9R19_08250 [Bacteroidota bacterium]|nr:hypothetical protein [Bacteroidota bacterium]
MNEQYLDAEWIEIKKAYDKIERFNKKHAREFTPNGIDDTYEMSMELFEDAINGKFPIDEFKMLAAVSSMQGDKDYIKTGYKELNYRMCGFMTKEYYEKALTAEQRKEYGYTKPQMRRILQRLKKKNIIRCNMVNPKTNREKIISINHTEEEVLKLIERTGLL